MSSSKGGEKASWRLRRPEEEEGSRARREKEEQGIGCCCCSRSPVGGVGERYIYV